MEGDASQCAVVDDTQMHLAAYLILQSFAAK
jgi:hypothetical protein